MEIKDKDKQILLELLKNGRASFSELGRHSKMSRQVVFSRIKSLKNRGIIKNFTVNLNEEKLGLGLKAYILIMIEPHKKARREVNDFLRKCKQISQIHYLFGRLDFLLEVFVKTREELTELLKSIQKFEAIKKTETFIVYDTVKYDHKDPVERVLMIKS